MLKECKIVTNKQEILNFTQLGFTKQVQVYTLLETILGFEQLDDNTWIKVVNTFLDDLRYKFLINIEDITKVEVYELFSDSVNTEYKDWFTGEYLGQISTLDLLKQML